MNDRTDIERVLTTWFDDGPTSMPDRVATVVADRISREHQRRPWRLDRRPRMTLYLKVAAGLAAAILIGVVGSRLLPGDGGVGTRPSPAPTTTPSPTPSGTPITARMVVQGQPLSWTATLPEGWNNEGWFLTPSQGPAGPTGIAVAAPGAAYVPSDPCDGVGKVSDAKTPEDVVAALRSRQDLVVSNVIDTALDGHPETRVDVQAPADLSACADLYIIMAEPGGAGFHVQGPSNKIRMWIVDVDGRPTVFQINSFAGTPADDMADAQLIIDSIVITP